MLRPRSTLLAWALFAAACAAPQKSTGAHGSAEPADPGAAAKGAGPAQAAAPASAAPGAPPGVPAGPPKRDPATAHVTVVGLSDFHGWLSPLEPRGFTKFYGGIANIA